MRRYTIEINQIAHVIDIDEVTADEFDVVVDGTPTRFRLSDHADLAQAAITPDVSTSARRAAPDQSRPEPVVRDLPHGELGGAPAPSASAHRPGPAVATGPAPATGAGADTMTAPMPGVVLSITAAPGQTVVRGDLVMVIEAMKMKNEIRVSRDGVIAEIGCAVGDQVKYGDVLVRFGAGA